MRAIEGTYADGKFVLHEPLPEGQGPCRFVLLVEDRAQPAVPAAVLTAHPPSAEHEFQALGMQQWAAEEADETTDWEHHFGLKD